MSDTVEAQKDRAPAAAPTRYRILFLSRDGRIEGIESIMASSDERALFRARAKVDGRAVEVWDGLRFVEHFDAKD